ncbi:MAG: HEPN domain-containing protein [Nanoarchaeota archaeon]
MDSLNTLYFQRSENELRLAQTIFRISEDKEIKSALNLGDMTFYSAVISHSYYSIFYSAIAYLLSKNIKISEKQGSHQKVFFEFKKLVEKGIIDSELLVIYEEVKIKAESLLVILKEERKKRTDFTYEKIPQANKDPAQTSLNNANNFFKYIYNIVKNKKINKT